MPYNMLDKKCEGWIHDEGRAGDYLETPPILSHNPALHVLGPGYLHAVFLLEFQILLVKGVDTINHGLDKLDLGVSKTMLVGNVISVSSLSA